MADFRVLARAHGFIKLAEVLLAAVCLGLIRHYDLHFGGDITTGSYQDRYLCGIITIGGFILVSLPLLLSYIWGEAGTYQTLLEMIYNFTGMVLFLTAGSLALDYYNSYKATGGSPDAGKALGALCIINGFFYLTDTVLAVRHSYATVEQSFT
ncbi:protein snakeskin-like isoform X1 [Artemia franciscana]|uniref:MARVEL domain-containing protein n=2 Tax=Artemia franciscana TaxID=6661 RepID=A0AA88I1G5_ARTSF|nr:hypothetical protein QYM36_002608 [Artemia franciscana]